MLVVNSPHAASLDNRIVFGPQLMPSSRIAKGHAGKEVSSSHPRLSLRDTVHTLDETRSHIMKLIAWSLNALCPSACFKLASWLP